MGLPVPLRLVRRQVPPQRREVASEAVTGAWGRAGAAAILTRSMSVMGQKRT
jgi:hypothetical protein